MSIANPYLYGHTPANKQEERLKRQASLASLSVAVLLIAVKFYAFLATDSVSLLSSLMDSLFDAMASIVTLVSLTQAALPADADHRFGHGKIEALGAICQSLFILASGIFLFIESVSRFITPQKISDPAIGFGVIIFSIVVTALLIRFQVFVIRKTSSVAISADHMHYKGDLLMNLGVFVSIGLGYYTGWHYFDPLFAIMIALWMLYGACKISRESLSILLDEEISDAEREQIIELVGRHASVKGLHDLRTRRTGDRVFIEFHMEVDPDLSMARVHDTMDEVEKTVFAAFPKSEVLIHPEPAGLDDHRIDHIIRS